MRRMVLVVTVVAVMAALMLAMAMPAFAAKGGNPTDSSCGLGKTTVHEANEDPTKPGASEDGTESTEFCSGR